MLHSPFARKLTAFVALSADDLQFVSDVFERRRKFLPGQDMIHEGQTNHSAFIMASGWASSYKNLADGTRQIVGFKIPGDFLGLRSVLLRTSDHNVEPITPVEASEIHTDDLLKWFEERPRLSIAVLWAVSRDEAMTVEHLVGLGRRNAAERTAHFLLEMAARLRLVGMGTDSGYSCPLSQYLIADALGLSAVHVNRVLGELREAGLVTFKDGVVTFDDFSGLVRFTDFDQAYLDHSGPLLK